MHQSSVYREAHPKLFRHLLFLLRHDQNKETLSLRNHLYPADVPVPVFQVHSMQYSYAPANFLYAVKYKKENPKIVFWAEEKEPGQVRFGIQDFGIGIPKEELPYVFQKGYVGKNLRKGNYYSTGMGLYFVEKIGKLLHIKISLSSEEGQGCCVTLDFQNLSEYFLTETDRKSVV